MLHSSNFVRLFHRQSFTLYGSQFRGAKYTGAEKGSQFKGAKYMRVQLQERRKVVSSGGLNICVYRAEEGSQFRGGG